MFDFSKKSYYLYLILNLLRSNGVLSRTQIGDMTSLRPATVSEITKELLDSGLIHATGTASQGKGRNQVLLSLNDNLLCAFGVSIGANGFDILAGTSKGKILYQQHSGFPTDCPPQEILSRITQALLTIKGKLSNRRILGLGVGDPGLIDAQRERSLFSSQMEHWRDIPLKAHLSDALNLPVYLEGADRLQALGERTFGLAQETQDFVCVQLGDGIGLSMMMGGKLLRGHNGAAGEFGHMHTRSGDRPCACGSFGCLETTASLSAVLHRAASAISRGAVSQLPAKNFTFEHFKQAAADGDKLCLNILHDAAHDIGDALSDVINLINPGMVIFHGPLSEIGGDFLSVIESCVRRQAIGISTRDLQFCVSNLKQNAAPLGGITMVFDNVLLTESFTHLSTVFPAQGEDGILG